MSVAAVAGGGGGGFRRAIRCSHCTLHFRFRVIIENRANGPDDSKMKRWARRYMYGTTVPVDLMQMTNVLRDYMYPLFLC